MFDIQNKRRNIADLNNYTLAKTLTMFRYENLPDTIPARELEKLLQLGGFAFVTEVNGNLYAFSGGLGGERDEYYRPTTITVANPALGVSDTFDINADGVLMKSDDMQLGFLPLMDKFHSLMVENQISMDLNSFNSRTLTFLSAADDKTRESAERFMKKLRDGEVSVIGDNAMFDGVKTHTGNAGSGSKITELIEYQQYLKSSLLGELGINAPFNMKRERVNSGEIDQHEESLSILVDNMKSCRVEALAAINEKYGTNITCHFAGVWGEKRNGQKENSLDSETNDSPDFSSDFREAEPEETEPEAVDAEPESEPEPEPEQEPEPMTTINEYLEGESLWNKVATRGTFPFIDGTTDKLFSAMYGKTPIYSAIENTTLDDLADMLAVMYADKWTQMMEAKGVEFGASETRKVTETTTSGEDSTTDTSGTQKVSAYNEAALIDDTGSERTETGNTTGNVDRELTDSTYTAQSAFDALQSADKLNIIRVALEDAANFIKLDIY